MSERKFDYSAFDCQDVTQFLFHPRVESNLGGSETAFEEITIPVGNNVMIGGRFYGTEKLAPILLFFHGNGEIAADYADIAQFYHRMNISFLPVDYRGYGKSTGTPNVSNMMEDCHQIFKYCKTFLESKGYQGALILMGRSLGSASALELVSHYENEIDGLIIESGFSFVIPLLRLLGINVKHLNLSEEGGFENFAKIKHFSKPTLIIHAEHDHIIPCSEGKTLFENAADKAKEFLMIPGANHNDILSRGLETYMIAVKKLIERAISSKQLT